MTSIAARLYSAAALAVLSLATLSAIAPAARAQDPVAPAPARGPLELGAPNGPGARAVTAQELGPPAQRAVAPVRPPASPSAATDYARLPRVSPDTDSIGVFMRFPPETTSDDLFLWFAYRPDVFGVVRRLRLDGTRVRDLEPVTWLYNLETLDLDGSEVENLQPLIRLRNLRELRLTGTRVRTLGPLTKLPNLERLVITDTQVSAEEVARLRRYNRGLRVTR